MKRLQFLFLSVLLFLFPTRVLAIEGEPTFRYLEAPQITWEDNRLSGKLKEVPVKAFLEELSLKEGFQLEIIGDLDQKVNAFLDHLTIDQSIKKIMRLTELDYIMILDGQKPPGGNTPQRIKKLIICRKEKKGLSSVTHPKHVTPLKEAGDEEKRFSLDHDDENAAIVPPIEPYQDDDDDNEIAERAEVQFEGSPDDLTNYVQDLSMDGRLSAEEYQVIMEKIEERKR